jgi:hypothetical protein
MFALGITLFVMGMVLLIYLRLSTHSQVRAMSPQTVLQRSCAISVMRERKRIGYVDSSILLTLGSLIILVTGVFN